MTTTIMGKPIPLERENLTAFIDMKTRLISYHFKDAVTPDDTAEIISWINANIENGIDPNSVRGAIYDFRDVRKFAAGSTPAAKETSIQGNEMPGVNMVPLVYLVKNVQQEVKVMMGRIIDVGRSKRRIVTYSPEYAFEFINKWNRIHDRNFDVPDDLLHTWPTMNG